MQPKIFTINSNNGLPNDQIHTISCDQYGRLWLPGPSGLSCYNGNKIKVFDTQNSLNCPGLRTAYISNHDIIWIGTDRGIEAIHLDGTKIDINLNFDWKYGIAECYFIKNQTIWVGTSFGLLEIENDNFSLNLISVLDVGLVKKIIEKDKNSIIILCAKKGLVEINNQKIITQTFDFLTENYPTTIYKSIDNHYFIGTSNGLYFLNSNLEILQHYIPKIGSPKVTSINSDSNELMVGFNKNLIILEHKINSLKELEIINVNSIINFIFIDDLKNIWIATNNDGLKKISFIRKSIIKIDTGFTDAAFSIYQTKQSNKFFIGGAQYFSDLSKNENQIIPILENQSEFKAIIWDTIEDEHDNSKIWLATQDGLFQTNINNPNDIIQKYASIISSPNRVLLTRDSEIWVGTISGLFCIKNNVATEILNNKKESFGYVYNLMLDTKDLIWIGTLGQGLWHETPNGFEIIIDSLLTENGNTYSIVPNSNDEILVIQQENIVLIDKNLNTSLILKEYPLGGWTAVWINQNTIAVGSSDGICIIDVKNKKLLHRINLYLEKSEWQFTSTRSLFLDNNENLICALNNGLYCINLKNLISNTATPKVYLDDINWINTNPIFSNNQYLLTEGKWSIEIDVYSDWHIDENHIKYRFKLAGFDENWSSLNNGFVKYNSLSAGKYELLVQSFTPLTGYSEPNSLLYFNVAYTWNTTFNKFRKKIASFFNLFKTSSIKNTLLLQQNERLKEEIAQRQIVQNELTHYKDQLEELVDNRTKDLESEKNKAEKADKLKSLFLANMSHEIRTPLGGIIGLNNILLQTNLDSSQKDYVQKIENSSEHLLQILNNILDISKIESDQIELEKIPFSLKKLFFDITEFAQIKIEDKPIEFKITKNIFSETMLIGDTLRLKQVFINLVSNAIKFTEKGSITLNVNQLKSIDEKIILHFEIIDTGIGMTPKQMKNLFKAFNQADSSISRKYGGTGLGLNISYKFVELMGGILNCTSKTNTGTTFSFTVSFDTDNVIDKIEQLVINPNNKNKLVSTKTNENSEENKKYKVLIAEDNLINQLVIKKMLEAKGYNVTLTNDGKKCIDVFSENQDFDIIFMDLRMPEMDGIEATKYIRNSMKNKTIPIIALTADVTLETQNNISKFLMNDYLSKPIDSEILDNIFEKWLVKK